MAGKPSVLKKTQRVKQKIIILKGWFILTKLFSIVLGISFLFLVGCGAPTTKTDAPAQKEQNTVSKNKVYVINEKATPVDGISIAVTGLRVQSPKGDRTKDNFARENGEYFADGSDIVKASDYNQIAISIEIENNTDKVINTSLSGWQAKLQDGYKLKGLSYYKDGTITNPMEIKQVASHNNVKATLCCTIEKTISIKEIDLTYNYLDYNDEWSKAIGEAISGKLTKEDYEKKFTPVPINWNLENS